MGEPRSMVLFFFITAMTKLEELICEVVADSTDTTKASQNLSKIKSFLNSSGEMVEAVNNFGDTLNTNLKESVGGLTGKLGGWIAGKTTKVVGGIGTGVVSGTLKTIATLIPNKGDLKGSELDIKISQLVDTYSLPTDKKQLFELLQFLYNNTNAEQPVFGEKTLRAMKKLHAKAYSHFCTLTSKEEEIYNLAKYNAPKKKFGLL